jgi:hypothetical protein
MAASFDQNDTVVIALPRLDGTDAPGSGAQASEGFKSEPAAPRRRLVAMALTGAASLGRTWP